MQASSFFCCSTRPFGWLAGQLVSAFDSCTWPESATGQRATRERSSEILRVGGVLRHPLLPSFISLSFAPLDSCRTRCHTLSLVFSLSRSGPKKVAVYRVQKLVMDVARNGTRSRAQNIASLGQSTRSTCTTRPGSCVKEAWPVEDRMKSKSVAEGARSQNKEDKKLFEISLCSLPPTNLSLWPSFGMISRLTLTDVAAAIPFFS